MKYTLVIISEGTPPFYIEPEPIAEEALARFREMAAERKESLEAVILEELMDEWEGVDSVHVAKGTNKGVPGVRHWGLVTSKITAISLKLLGDRAEEE